MSKRIQYAHSYPVLPSAPAAETNRLVLYARDNTLYVKDEDGVEVGLGQVTYASPNGTTYRIIVANDGTPSTIDARTVVWDSFNRANETPVGTTDSGHAYIAAGGTGLSVISEQLGRVTAGTQGSVVDAEISDCRVEYTVSIPAGSAGIALLRYTDANNYLYLRDDGWLREVVAGAVNVVEVCDETFNSGDDVEVLLNGSNVSVHLNNVQVLAPTPVSIVTGTKFGFQTSSSTWRIDEFSVTALV